MQFSFVFTLFFAAMVAFSSLAFAADVQERDFNEERDFLQERTPMMNYRAAGGNYHQGLQQGVSAAKAAVAQSRGLEERGMDTRSFWDDFGKGFVDGFTGTVGILGKVL